MTGQPLIFKPKKWQGVAGNGFLGVIVLAIYPFVRNSVNDAELLLVLAGIFFIATFFVLMIDINKAELYYDRIVVYFPCKVKGYLSIGYS